MHLLDNLVQKTQHDLSLEPELPNNPERHLLAAGALPILEHLPAQAKTGPGSHILLSASIHFYDRDVLVWSCQSVGEQYSRACAV